MTFVSKKSARICLIASQAIRGRKGPAELPQIGKDVLGFRTPADREPGLSPMELDFIAGLQAKLTHKLGGKGRAKSGSNG